jgi:hypothetical protein
MIECIPWEIGGGDFFHDIFVTMENERRQGILCDGRGNHLRVNVIVLQG